MTKEEAIKRIQSWNLDNDKIEVLSVIIPELKENEDEKIRKAIFKALSKKDARDVLIANGIQVGDALTWLKKQGKNNIGISEATKQKLEDNLNKALGKETPESWNKFLDEQGEQNPTWSEEDERIWRELLNFHKAAANGEVEILPDIRHDIIVTWLEKKCEQPNPYSGISFEYNGHIWGMCARDNGVDILLDKQLFKHLDEKQGEQTTDKIIERAKTEKQRILLTETNGDAHIDWDCRSLQDVKSLLKYGLEYIDAQLEKQGEKKPAWSKEDEVAWNNTMIMIKECAANHYAQDSINLVVTWLKSLKDQVQLQPKQELNEEVVNEYVDLGLPSGTLWKPFNEEGYYTYDEAMEKFSGQLPSKEQWEELKNKCKWEWKGAGYEVTGPNGNTIFLLANGYRYGTGVLNVGTCGYYWSSTYHNKDVVYYMGLNIGGTCVNNGPRFCGQSVRLVK